MIRRGRSLMRGNLRGYARALLAALMIVVGLLLFTIALTSVINGSN